MFYVQKRKSVKTGREYKDMVDGRTQPEEVVALDPSTGEVSQLSIDDLADKLD